MLVMHEALVMQGCTDKILHWTINKGFLIGIKIVTSMTILDNDLASWKQVHCLPCEVPNVWGFTSVHHVWPNQCQKLVDEGVTQ